MIVWSGFGFLTVLLFAVCVGGGASFGEQMGWATGYVFGVSFLIGGLLNWFIGLWFNNPAKDRELVDPRTGGKVILRSRHSLFWIPMHYWSVPALLAGIVSIGLEATGNFPPPKNRSQAPRSVQMNDAPAALVQASTNSVRA